jgi:Tol biopolymer transport system component
LNEPDSGLADYDFSNSTALSPAGYAPDWSPDGTNIAFISDRTGPNEYGRRTNEIWVMDADGSRPTALTNIDSLRPPTQHLATVGRPSWSPDGQQIMFSAYLISDKLDIYSMNSDGSSLVNLSNTPDKAERSLDW